MDSPASQSPRVRKSHHPTTRATSAALPSDRWLIHFMKIRILLTTLLASQLFAAEENTPDIVVYGGTSGGIIAAVQDLDYEKLRPALLAAGQALDAK